MVKKNIPKKSNLSISTVLKTKFTELSLSRKNFLDRRPHRTLRRTRRRDLPKHAPLPGFVSFTLHVFRTIRQYRGAFAVFLILYVVIGSLLVGITNQENYKTLTDSFGSLGQDLLGGNIDTATQTMALFGAAITGSLADTLTEVQQMYLLLIGMFTWLSVVWYLRHRLAGTVVKVRDALYGSGAPFISTLLIALFMVIQLIPGAVGVLIYSTASTTGVLQGGIESFIFVAAALLLCVLSLYWATSSFFALLIVTIPGTYPLPALKMGSDIVLGRRVSVMLRLLWLGLVLLILWAIVLIPIILIAGKISLSWLPLVPITIQILGGCSVLISGTYVYLLYRKMIDEPAI